MLITDTMKDFVRSTPLAVPYILLKNVTTRATSQSDEAEILTRIISRIEIPKRFVEFGFSGFEFNTIDLARRKDWQGLLVDGGSYNVRAANLMFHSGIRAEQMWIDLTSLQRVADYAASNDLGVLSIDVDGNDYWFLQKLITLRPALIIAEFNVTLGQRPVTVPYDPLFDRWLKHESGEYYGASIVAIDHLCRSNGYSLVAISRNGVNAFFLRNDLLPDDWARIEAGEMRLEKRYPDGSKAPTEQFWEQIKMMPFVDVIDMAPATFS